ncbi:hypothetical protein PHAMO_20088 [Magnetospirillum molischianum DSM 120]|uniref:AdoMet activation domain-containing protein n=1 Tax=Magnetospirillum molischianum DSM 120 TaxID=1150626 RepID=H8FPW4_MAGML|nr:hypothetical protein PHAMO_20088 [Magnetospirillum molischianum DSM 120]
MAAGAAMERSQPDRALTVARRKDGDARLVITRLAPNLSIDADRRIETKTMPRVRFLAGARTC